MFFSKPKQPSSGQIQHLMTLYTQNRLQEIIEQATLLACQFPQAEQLFNILSVAYNGTGRYHQAVSSAVKAIELKPGYAKAYLNQGNALRNLDCVDEALASYSKAIQLEPNFAEAHNNLGALLMEIGRYNEAIASFSKSIELRSDYATALNNLGCAYIDVGRKNDATVYFSKAITNSPDYAEAHLNLSTIKRYNADDPQITQMSTLMKTTNLTDQDRMYLCFAMAKAEEDLGNADGSFHYLQEGNKLRHALSGYHINDDCRLFRQIKSSFAMMPPQQSASADDRYSPLFIVGMPRSGTTLIEQILSSHSKVHAAGEVPALDHALQSIGWKGNMVSQRQLQALHDHYFSWIENLDIDKRYITDKSTINFRWIGFILQAIPEARVIHIKRDARATCWSIYKHFFGSDGFNFGYDLNDVSEYYKLYVDLMDFWEQHFSGRIHHISYETLTKSQENETRKLLDYCGLHWEEQCLEFHKSKRAVNTASKEQVRKKMYQGSSDAWCKFEEHLGPMIKQLEGY